MLIVDDDSLATEVRAKAESLAGGTVRVRGAVGVGPPNPIPFPFNGGQRCDSSVSCCDKRDPEVRPIVGWRLVEPSLCEARGTDAN